MKFYMPTTVYQERDCVKNHREELAALGSRALIVTGRSSAKRNGSYVDVCEALDACGVTHCLFDKVEENPSLETVMEARDYGIAEGVDFVIGIGGGSPMDAAKAIALMIANSDKDIPFMYEKVDNPKVLPVVAIPTTCGTGSEVTGVSVLTNHSKKTKGSIIHRIYPEIALVDGKYLEAAPVSVLCNTATDAFAHLVESYIHVSATDYSRMFVREGLRVWKSCKSALLAAVGRAQSQQCQSKVQEGIEVQVDAKVQENIKSQESVEVQESTEVQSASGVAEITAKDYDYFMLASTYAGMAIAHTGTSIPHALSYYLTYNLGIPHGKACGYFISAYLREASAADREAVLEMSGFTDVDELETFLTEICRMEPLTQEVRENTAEQVAANPAKLALAPFPVDREVLNRIAGL